MQQEYGKLIAWVRIDGYGNVIPGTLCYKKIGIVPKDGRWKQISGNYCCGSNDSFLIIYNNSTNLITSITSSDGTVNLTGLAIGSGAGSTSEYLVIDLPNGYDYSITAKATSNYGGSPSLVNLFGGVSPSISVTGSTAVLTIPVGPAQQYLATLN